MSSSVFQKNGLDSYGEDLRVLLGGRVWSIFDVLFIFSGWNVGFGVVPLPSTLWEWIYKIWWTRIFQVRMFICTYTDPRNLRNEQIEILSHDCNSDDAHVLSYSPVRLQDLLQHPQYI